ncbi:hypothetical protein AMELA_G00199020 [Ameiurus melas]|uniref:Uncharacterized protein n=1 Tax=Ameiurus melas TaxID=219545 RepID=A0A7J6AAC9_AMEME|nr:hypothetical protein AMELA_G00199020 [Ameiurus melas]
MQSVIELATEITEEELSSWSKINIHFCATLATRSSKRKRNTSDHVFTRSCTRRFGSWMRVTNTQEDQIHVVIEEDQSEVKPAMEANHAHNPVTPVEIRRRLVEIREIQRMSPNSRV